MISSDRMAHQLAVARRIVRLAKQSDEYSEEDLQRLFLMGYMHDIGYEFAEDPNEHALVGGKILERSGFKYWQEVAYHGDPASPYMSKELDILNVADMQTSPAGERISFDERLEGIRDRYGSESKEYRNAKVVIHDLIEKGFR